MQIANHIKELRKTLGWTQAELADKAGLASVQVGRYENDKSTPTIEVLVKLADALNTTTDFLINGATGKQAVQHIKDKELLQLFSSVDDLNGEDKNVIKVLIDAFITKRKLQQIA